MQSTPDMGIIPDAQILDQSGQAVATEVSQLDGPCYATLLTSGKEKQLFISPTLAEAALGLGELLKAAVLEGGTGQLPSAMRFQVIRAVSDGGKVSLPEGKKAISPLVDIRIGIFKGRY